MSDADFVGAAGLTAAAGFAAVLRGFITGMVLVVPTGAAPLAETAPFAGTAPFADAAVCRMV